MRNGKATLRMGPLFLAMMVLAGSTIADPACTLSPPPACTPVSVSSPPPACTPVAVSSPPPACTPVTVKSPPPACTPVTVSSPPPACTPVTVKSPPPACTPVTTYSPPACTPVTVKSPAPACVTTYSPPACTPVTVKSPPACTGTNSPPACTPVTVKSPPACTGTNSPPACTGTNSPPACTGTNSPPACTGTYSPPACTTPTTPSPSPPPPCASIYEIVAGNPDLSVLKAAIDAAGLADALKNKALKGTLFAPTNSAVLTCFKIGCLNQATLLYHLIATAGLSSSDLIAQANPQWWQMANGGKTKVSSGAVVTIAGDFNFATVITANIQSCSGYVHIIDTVLNPGTATPPLPPAPPACSPNAYEAISNIPELAEFKQLIDRSGRKSFFQNPYLTATIFAPIDSWVGPLGVDEAYVVNTHVVMGRPIAAPLPLAGQTLTSVSGQQYTVDFDAPASAPQNLRLRLGKLTSTLQPNRLNIASCSYTIHLVGTTFWSVAPITNTGNNGYPPK